MKRLILLDSHAILHRAYHALPDFATSGGEPTGALYGLSMMVLSAVEHLKPDYVVATYDLPKPTHRHIAYKDYKAGRAKTDGALVSQIVKSREIFQALSIPMYDKEGYEADDMLGTIVELTKNDKDLEVIIASGDMDTLQLVTGKKVQVYTLKKGIKDTIMYDEKAVIERYGFIPTLLPDYKGLRGDPSDNIIGIKGIGDKTATTLITTFGSVEDIYKKLEDDENAFREIGITPRMIDLLKNGKEDAEFSKVLATIRRDAPIKWSLPKKTWKESVDIEKASKLFASLEFRTMSIRLKQTLGASVSLDDAFTGLEDKPIVIDATTLDQAKLAEAFIMLWLIDSNKTDPSLDDVMQFTQSKTFDGAYEVLSKEIDKRKLRSVYEDIEKPLIPLMGKMKETGIQVDADYLKKLGTDYTKELKKIEKTIWSMAGEEFNVASPKQLGEILYVKLGLKTKGQKKTSTGALSTKESELVKLAEEHPIVDEILKYRELSKLLGTYIEAIPPVLGEDSRLHARLIQAGTTTGRMSSESPNIQNIPNKTELGRAIRNAFVAKKGFKLVSFDYSQIELRIAAFLSKDPKFVKIFTDGEDVHSAVASQVFDVPVEKITKGMRTQAKTINFGVMYGMGVNALRANLGTDRATAQKFYNEYFEKFSGLRDYLESVKASAGRKGYTETFFGRRRYFEGLKSRLPFIRASAERMAINAPIQGTEADIVKLAIIKIDAWLQKEGLDSDVKMLMQVHDEIMFEVKESAVSKIIEPIKKIMESIIDPKDIQGIVCSAEANVGLNWGEMEKV